MTDITRRVLVKIAMATPVAIALRPANATGPVSHEVRITSFKFQPETLDVRAGDSIIFSNDDIAPHTATADDKSWDTGKLKQGESATVDVAENFAGDYFCRYHPKMKGKLAVV